MLFCYQGQKFEISLFPKRSPRVVIYWVVYSFRKERKKRRAVCLVLISVAIFLSPSLLDSLNCSFLPFLPCPGCARHSLSPTRPLTRTRKCNYSHSLCFHFVCINSLPFPNKLSWPEPFSCDAHGVGTNPGWYPSMCNALSCCWLNPIQRDGGGTVALRMPAEDRDQGGSCGHMQPPKKD